LHLEGPAVSGFVSRLLAFHGHTFARPVAPGQGAAWSSSLYLEKALGIRAGPTRQPTFPPPGRI
jgi:hypothetical protein